MKVCKWKNVLFTAISFLVLCSFLTGCFQNKQEKTPEKTGTNTVEQTKTNDEVAGNNVEDPFGKYDPPITVTFVRFTDDAIEQNVLKNLEGETLEDNRWLKLYEEELGIKIKYDWIAKGQEQFTQKMNIAISSGDLPDFIPVTSIQLKQLAEADMITDIKDVYEKYASEDTKKYLTLQGTAPLDAATIDGKLWGLPQIKPSYDSIDYLWIRLDWLEKLGLDAPKTMDDVLNIIEVFATKDPDGNNVNDTVGLVVHKDLFGYYASLTGFFNGYHAYPNTWIEDENGKLVYGSVQPEMKTPLLKLQELYKKGYMDKEFGVKDFYKVSETVIAGKSGLHYGASFNSLWPLQALRDIDPKSDWQAFPIVSADDKPVKVTYNMGTTTWVAVNKNAKNPEALVKLFNMFVEKCWSENAQYDYYFYPPNAEGTWKLSPISVLPDIDIYTEIKEAERTGDASKLKGAAKYTWDLMELYKAGDDKLWGVWRGNGGEGATSATLEKYISGNHLMMNKYVGPPTPTLIEKWATLTKMQNEVFTKIILGNAGIEEFDKFVDDWNKLGGEAITQEVNEWYSNIKK